MPVAAWVPVTSQPWRESCSTHYGGGFSEMKTVPEIRSIETREPGAEAPVLVVDLDGTLVKTDLLTESFVALMKQKPLYMFWLPFWFLRGKAYLKQQVARMVSLDIQELPYRRELLDYLRRERTGGRRLALATGSDQHTAMQIADHCKLFDVILASDGSTNLSGERKRACLVKWFGEKGFDYIGNSRRDLPVWASARRSILVNPSAAVLSDAERVADVDRVFEGKTGQVAEYLNVLRPPHWVKNLLVFAPLVAAHRLDEFPLLVKLLWAFVAFSFFASSGYIVNDLLDLGADRHHPGKKLRPFASGDLPLAYALTMVPILVGLGCWIGALVSGGFLLAALSYLALSLSYSLWLKRIVVLDVIFLAGLYAIRIMAGGAAVSIWPSHWLLAFSTFLFFGLALVKRYGELVVMKRVDGDQAHARAYELTDAELLAAMGIASGYLAVLVLVLYISSATAARLYGRFELIWLLCPLLLYWISYIWLIAHRGRMPDDPVVFATHDRTSLILIALMLAISLLAL